MGDYTALLAAECERRGCVTLRVALDDGYVAGAQESDGLLRLGRGVGVEGAREAVERFGAGVVSVQWVPYSFHPKGLPRGIDRALARIAGGRAAHVMCHETWIGAETGADVKSRVIGAAQRKILRRVALALRPACVHTSNPAYAGLLRKAGIAAEVLPLFGSIPVAGVTAGGEEGVARFGMFGTLHPAWPAEPLLGRLRELGKRIVIEHIGRIGPGEAVWREMERRYGAEYTFRLHGEQPAARVSQFLMAMDFGIATTPLALLGKSATATAMFEHGLPVIVNRDDVRYPGIDAGPAPDGAILMDEGFIGALRTARRREPRSRLPEVASQFLESLSGRRAGMP